MAAVWELRLYFRLFSFRQYTSPVIVFLQSSHTFNKKHPTHDGSSLPNTIKAACVDLFMSFFFGYLQTGVFEKTPHRTCDRLINVSQKTVVYLHMQFLSTC